MAADGPSRTRYAGARAFHRRKRAHMKAFDFVIVFLSFIYALALSHMLQSTTAMIADRHKIRFSAPLLVWMIVAFILLAANWVSLWDFHSLQTIELWPLALLFLVIIVQYLICELISPKFKDDDDFDLVAFQDRRRTTYLGTFVSFFVLALIINIASGPGLGLQKWTDENTIVLGMLAIALVALLFKANTVQLVAGIVLIGLEAAYVIVYYPVLQ
jgi:hypothetical protein